MNKRNTTTKWNNTTSSHRLTADDRRQSRRRKLGDWLVIDLQDIGDGSVDYAWGHAMSVGFDHGLSCARTLPEAAERERAHQPSA